MSSVTTSENGRPEPHQVISVPDTGYIQMLVYHPDGQRVVFSTDDGPIKVWNLEKNEQEGIPMVHEGLSVDRIAVTSDRTRIISSDGNGNIKVWDVESQKIVREWTHRGGLSKISVSPDGQLIAVSHRSNVFLYTTEGRQVYHSIKVGILIWSMSFSPGNDKLACGTRSDVYVYDVVSGTLVLGPLKGHGDGINRMLWSHDGSSLLSASNDNTIRQWNSDTGEQNGEPWKHNYSINSLSLSPDGSKLASASSGDKTIRFWDTISGSPITQHLRHPDVHSDYAATFSPSGHFLASAGCCGRIYLWRVPWLELVDSRASHATNLNSILPDLSLGFDERQRIFEVRLRKMLDLATSKGFHVSRDVFPPSLPVGAKHAPSIGTERIADCDENALDALPIEPVTLVSDSNSNGDIKETPKVNRNKRKFVDMLRDIVFKGFRGKDT